MASVETGGDDFAAVRGIVPSREAVAADVRRVIGGCRSRGDFQRLDTPALDQLLALGNLSHDDGPELLARGIAAVDRAQYRQFLELLLPLPFDEGERWSALGPSRRGPGRGDRAAAVFGLDTWDGCTRPSVALEDRSRRDWAELHLAAALIQVATANLGPGPGSIPRHQGRWRPRASVLVAAAIGLVAIATIGVLTVRSGDPPKEPAAATTPTTVGTDAPQGVLAEQCVAAGQLDSALAAEAGAAEIAATLQNLHRGAGGDAVVGCALAPAHRWKELVVQELDSGEVDFTGAIVVSGPGNGVVLTPAQWGSYRQVGAADGSAVQAFGGAPERVVHRADGVVEVELAKGVLLVGEHADAPHFWIFPQYVSWWRAHPELGLPTSNPTLDLSQEFEHGRATVSSLGAEPVAELVADPAAELPPKSTRRGHILRQDDRTSWWIDADDRRHWVPTGGVWACLGGEEVEIDGVPGYAIASLDLGDHAECPDKS